MLHSVDVAYLYLDGFGGWDAPEDLAQLLPHIWIYAFIIIISFDEVVTCFAQ
jgi:hypothetical protein